MTPEPEPIGALVRLGRRLRTARSRTGLGQASVAREIGVSEATYANWEKGRTGGALVFLPQLAKVFATTEEDLAGDVTAPAMATIVERLDEIVKRLDAIETRNTEITNMLRALGEP